VEAVDSVYSTELFDENCYLLGLLGHSKVSDYFTPMNSSKLDSLTIDNLPNEPISNVDAIAAHLNQSIATEGIMFEASLDEKILKITVKTEQIVESDTISKSVRDELLKLKLTNIDLVQLYKQKLRRNNCYKLNEFTIISAAEPAVEPARKIQSQSQPKKGADIQKPGTQRPSAQKPLPKVNQPKQIGLLVLFIALAIFGIWLTVTRLSRWFLSPFGLIGAVFGLPLLFKYYGMLFKLWQSLTHDKDNNR
jgi:hypothetical protein